MARPKLRFELSTEQRAELLRLIQAQNIPQKLVRRARIGLLAADSKDNKKIAAELGTSHLIVGLWRQRILDLRLASLQESSPPGRSKTLPVDRVHTVLNEVVSPPNGWGAVELPDHGSA
jgi:hypothetical protein